MAIRTGVQGHAHRGTIRLCGTLNRIANKIDFRTPKVVRRVIKCGRPHILLGDEQVLQIIRRYRRGEKGSALATEFGCFPSDVSNWVTETNRCKLLRQIENEERTTGLKSSRNRADAKPGNPDQKAA